MKDRPILFQGDMVRATLDDIKTQTRRIFKAKNGGVWPNANDLPGMRQILRNCPSGQPGQRLWVRESHRSYAAYDSESFKKMQSRLCVSDAEMSRVVPLRYDADDHRVNWLRADAKQGKVRPSIHMPRWASRITLEITGVRVERLQDISEADAQAEGVVPCARRVVGLPGGCDSHLCGYRQLWSQINGKGSWDANPWVWVVEFKRVDGGAL